MRTVDDYLDMARATRGFASDGELARYMGVSTPALSAWRRRRQWPSDERMVLLAELCNIDPREALADLNIWRSESPTARRVYEQMKAAFVAALLLVAFLHPPANAAGTDQQIISTTVYYVK